MRVACGGGRHAPHHSRIVGPPLAGGLRGWRLACAAGGWRLACGAAGRGVPGGRPGGLRRGWPASVHMADADVAGLLRCTWPNADAADLHRRVAWLGELPAMRGSGHEASIEQSQHTRSGGGLRAAMYIQFAVDMFDMLFYGASGDEEAGPDLLIGIAFREQAQDR